MHARRNSTMCCIHAQENTMCYIRKEVAHMKIRTCFQLVADNQWKIIQLLVEHQGYGQSNGKLHQHQSDASASSSCSSPSFRLCFSILVRLFLLTDLIPDENQALVQWLCGEPVCTDARHCLSRKLARPCRLTLRAPFWGKSVLPRCSFARRCILMVSGAGPLRPMTAALPFRPCARALLPVVWRQWCCWAITRTRSCRC